MSSNAGGGNVPDWQGETGPIQKAMKHMLETGLDSDVQFLVGNGNALPEEKELFKAHSFVLSMRSSVFAAQFRFDGLAARNNAVPIEVTDIPAPAFNAMLNFLYTSDLSLVNNKNIVGVYIAAKKYFLQALAQKCIELAEKMLDVKNVFGMLKMAKLHGEEILLKHCWTFIDVEIDHFDSEDFYELNEKEMGELLARDSLQAEELNIFYRLYNWAAKQCENAGILEPTGEQKRAEMGKLLKAIRFPLIPPMDFIEKIVPMGILNNDEISSMLLHYSQIESKKGHPPLPFFTKHRAILPREHNNLVDKFVTEKEKAEKDAKIEKLQKENEFLRKEKAKTAQELLVPTNTVYSAYKCFYGPPPYSSNYSRGGHRNEN